MMYLPVPPVPDLARIGGSTPLDMIDWLIEYYNQKPVSWNYVTANKCVKACYQGLSYLKPLLDACDKMRAGRAPNYEVVKLAGPLAFGRKMQVFDLPKRQFHFGRDLRAAYRVPFFFVEAGVVKLYYLQPRKGANLSYDQMCMVGTIHKRFLLDTEFYGQPCDVEYVDVGAPLFSKDRVLREYSLDTLELWDDRRLADRLTMIAEALEQIRGRGLVQARTRARKPDSEMPLFD